MRRPVNDIQGQRLRSFRASMSVWIALLILVMVIIVIGQLKGMGFEITTPRIVMASAFALLIFRQVVRRLRSVAPRAAEPDPKSALKLS